MPLGIRPARPGSGLDLPGDAQIAAAPVLLVLGRRMTTKTSADLWFRPLTPRSVAGEYAGAFGTACEAIGIVWEPCFYFWCGVFLILQTVSFPRIDLAPHGFQ